VLTEYYNVHNHPLEIYDNSNVITEEIFWEDKVLKMTNADTLTITDIINKDYEIFIPLEDLFFSAQENNWYRLWKA